METSQLLPPSRLDDSALLSTLDAVEAALSTLEVYRLQLLADLDHRGLAGERGARDTIELLALRHHRNRREIRRDLKTAHALPRYTAVTSALPNPTSADTAPARLNPAQAEAIVTTLEKAPASVPDDVLQVAEEQMIEAARHLTPDKLLDFGRQVIDRLDTDGPEPAEDDAAAIESLTLRRADGGVKFNGYLAGENAEQLQTQINRLSKPHRTTDGALDPRPHPKRQADALSLILNLANTNTPRTSHNPTTPSTADWATDATADADTSSAPRTADDPANSHGPGVPHITITIDLDDLRTATSQAVGELVYGDNLSASAVRRLACDAAILPIVLGSDSQPLDVGTEQRFVTRHIRRALIKRDKGCVICKALPWQCHAHHLIHWVDGSSTSITNLVLLCAGHHRAVHSGHWSITITNGVVDVTRPTWTTPGATNRKDLASLTSLSRYFSQVGVNSHSEPPNQLPATSLPEQPGSQPALQTDTRRLPRLTHEAVALLDPWGDSGTPSADP